MKSIHGNEGHDLQKEETEQVTESMRLIHTHTEGPHHAKVYKDTEWGEYRVKYFKNGKHLPKADSHHDEADDAHGTAKHELKRMNESVEQVVVTEATSGYRIYHPQYSQAVQHALHHHNQKHGLTHDEDDYHQKVTHGPRKPAEGETRTHNILAYDKNGNEHVIHMQIYNRGGEHSPYELNTYHSKVNKKLQKEETEQIIERNKENKLKKDIFVTKLGMKKEPWYKTHIADVVQPTGRDSMKATIVRGKRVGRDSLKSSKSERDYNTYVRKEEVQMSEDELARLASIAELFDEAKKKEKGVPSQTTIGSAPTRGANQDQSGFNTSSNASDYSISD